MVQKALRRSKYLRVTNPRIFFSIFSFHLKKKKSNIVKELSELMLISLANISMS